MTYRDRDSNPDVFPTLSKRAARRIIQRAWVLTSRDRHVRQHLRTAEFSTLWVLEDWNFHWTVVFNRGHIELDRRVTKQPDLTYTWQSAAAFFAGIEKDLPPAEGFSIQGDVMLHKLCAPLFKTFARTLAALLREPVDENGKSLL